MRSWKALVVLTALAGCATTPSGGSALPRTEAEIATGLAEHAARLADLEKASNLAWFEASVTGTDEAFARSREAADALDRFHADPALFAWVEAARSAGVVKDALLARQLDVLWRAMLGKQVAPALLERITGLETQVEQAFNTYRGKVDGQEVTNNEIEQLLRSSTDSEVLRRAWEAQKSVGPVVAPKLRELVGLRNEVARKLGFRDYFELRLAELELDEGELLALFEELDRLTREPFLAGKAEVDRRLAARLGLSPEALMPWHYHNPFFQEPPKVFETGLDAAYRQRDLLSLCRAFYEGIGLEVGDILARSDLYEKPGKTPHAFAVHVDRGEDVRVLANIVPGQDWQTTMIHELGHAVYSAGIDPKLPWLLRKAAHPLTTEGLAMMLDRLVANPIWAEHMGVVDAAARAKAADEAARELAFAALVFSRWTQVMLHFERELYANPEQDLNALWWSLVERYQGLRRPEGRDAPDYASKIHVVIVPVYYQNYMLGELFAAQLHERLAGELGLSPEEAVFVGRPEVGDYLSRAVFALGRRHPWAELVEQATGKPLSAEAFARRFED